MGDGSRALDDADDFRLWIREIIRNGGYLSDQTEQEVLDSVMRKIRGKGRPDLVLAEVRRFLGARTGWREIGHDGDPHNREDPANG